MTRPSPVVSGWRLVALGWSRRPGGGPDVHVYDVQTGQLIKQFWAFDPSFTGGVFVAVGDVNADGFPDIIAGADAGGGPQVRVFSGKDFSLLRSFFPFDASFTGGVRVAAGDVNHDGYADIVSGAGPGGGPNVTVVSGKGGSVLDSFFAYDQRFSGGVYVAALDVNGDLRADIITAAGAGGGPDVHVYDATNLTLLSEFFAAAPDFTAGVPIAALVTSSGKPGLVVGPSTTGGRLEILDPLSGVTIDSFFVRGGMYVAATPG